MPETSGISQIVALENLRFDPGNPRLPSNLVGADENQILEWMLSDASLIELMGSIGEVGFFPGEPLLVVPKEDDEGAYTVVEGNRRLAAVKLLNNPEIAPTRKKSVNLTSEAARVKPDRLPVLVYSTREDILNYLGYRHVTGIKPWSSLAKARYVAQLYSGMTGETDEIYKKLAKTIGSRSDYVVRLLTTLEIYQKIKEEEFYNIPGLNEETLEFSVLSTAISYSNISNFLGLKNNQDRDLEGLVEERLRELTNWMFRETSSGVTRVSESRDLKDLAKVVEYEDALQAFRDGKPLEDAVLFTDFPDEIFHESILKAMSNLQLARNYSHRLKDPIRGDEETLREMILMARDLLTLMRSKNDELLMEGF